jgi:hypothetical protein
MSQCPYVHPAAETSSARRLLVCNVPHPPSPQPGLLLHFRLSLLGQRSRGPGIGAAAVRGQGEAQDGEGGGNGGEAGAAAPGVSGYTGPA